jgi:hypothetical protein
MRVKIQIEARGDDIDLKDFTKLLKEENISYSLFPQKRALPKNVKLSSPTLRGERVSRERRITLKPFKVARRSVVEALAVAVIVEITKEALKTILSWLKERRKKGLRNPRLEVRVNGNILKLNAKSIKVLETLLKEASNGKQKRKADKDGSS